MANALRTGYLATVSDFGDYIHAWHTNRCGSWFSFQMSILMIILNRFDLITLFTLIYIENESKYEISVRVVAVQYLNSKEKYKHVSSCSAGAICRVLDAVNGRNNAPNTAQFKTIPESTNKVPRQVYSKIRKFIRGAKMNVPRPDPATAIPVPKKKQTRD